MDQYYTRYIQSICGANHPDSKYLHDTPHGLAKPYDQVSKDGFCRICGAYVNKYKTIAIRVNY